MYLFDKSIVRFGVHTLSHVFLEETSWYKKENTAVCFDPFPSHVGAFIELEAFSEEKLIALKELMASPEHCRISKNYGKIIQDSLKKQGLDSDRSRIYLFDETLRQFAYKKFHR